MIIGGAASLLREAREVANDATPRGADVPRLKIHHLAPVALSERPPWNPSVGSIPPLFTERRPRVFDPYVPPLVGIHRELNAALPPFITLLHPIDRRKPLSGDFITPRPPVTSRPPQITIQARSADRSKSAPRTRATGGDSEVPDATACREEHAPEDYRGPRKVEENKASHRSILMPSDAVVAQLLQTWGGGVLTAEVLDNVVTAQWPQLARKRQAVLRALRAADTEATGAILSERFGLFLQCFVYYINFYDVFKRDDETGDRKLTREAFERLAPALGVATSAVFSELDTTNTACIYLGELAAWLARHRPGLKLDDMVLAKRVSKKTTQHLSQRTVSGGEALPPEQQLTEGPHDGSFARVQHESSLIDTPSTVLHRAKETRDVSPTWIDGVDEKSATATATLGLSAVIMERSAEKHTVDGAASLAAAA